LEGKFPRPFPLRKIKRAPKSLSPRPPEKLRKMCEKNGKLIPKPHLEKGSPNGV